MDVVLSFEHFANITNFPGIVCNTISDLNDTANVNTNGKTLIDKMKTGGYTSYTTLVSDWKTYVGASVDNFASSTNAISKSWLFSINNTATPNLVQLLSDGPFCHIVVNQFSGQVAPILTAKDDTSSLPYKNNMQAIFIAAFKVLYGQFRYSGYTGTTLASIPQMTNTDITAALNTILSNFESKVYSYMLNTNTATNTYNPIGTFLQNFYTDLVAYAATSTVTGFNMFMYNLFFIAFQPYFCFLYVVYQIPSVKQMSTNQAIRNNAMRGAAVLGTYKFVTYTLYGTYKLMAGYDPASSDALLLRQAIDTNAMSLFNSEMQKINVELATTNESMQTTFEEMGSLDDVNRQITMARGNAMNISSNEAQVTKMRSNAALIKWTWVTITVLYIVAFCVVFFLFKKNNIVVQSFLGISASLLIILCIIGIVSVAN